MNSLRTVDISNNLGDSKSLITHPATTTHRRMGEEARAAIGITDATLRISVGLGPPTTSSPTCAARWGELRRRGHPERGARG